MCEFVTTKDESQSPPKKRSLFSKQVLAKGCVANNPVDFFSRAKIVYPKLLEEEEEKRKIKVRKTERWGSAKNIKEGSITNEQSYDVNSQMRSKNQPDHEDNVWAQRKSKSPLGFRDSVGSDNVDSISAGQGDVAEPKRKPRLRRPSSLNSYEPSRVTINLDSDDETPQITTNHIDNNLLGSLPSRESVAEPQIDNSDEEYPELIQQARDREKFNAQKLLSATKYSEEQNLQTLAKTSSDIFETEPQSAAELDPTIELLITSELEGTRPLRIKRKFSQRLKEARLTWCDKQDIKYDSTGKSIKDVIFFTWQGKRLFDATTCGSLGFKLNENGNLTPIRDNVDARGNIHLEAWTEDALKLKEKIPVSQSSLGKENGEQETDLPHIEKGPSYKLIMKARDMDPFKLVVKPKTTIAKMADAFRRARAIPESTKISLHFDGDILDPKSTVEETELGDTDDVVTIEVYFK